MADWQKDPDATSTFAVDFTGVLSEVSDAAGETVTLTAATWTVPDDLTAVATGTSTPKATIKLSGGTANAYYRVTCHATFSNDDTDDRTAILYVREG